MKNGNSDLLKEFSAEQVAKLDGIIARYKGKPGGLIPVLEEAQVTLDYLPVSVQRRIAEGLNLPLAQVYGVVTFYSFFTMKPRGRHTVRVCLGTACYVRGGKAIAESIVKEINVEEGETTQDRRFTYETVSRFIEARNKREVSTKDLARTLGVKAVHPCDPAAANRHTGYMVGGTSPFGTKKALPVYAEETILSLPVIYINAGRKGLLVEMKPADLVRVLKPVPVKVGR